MQSGLLKGEEPVIFKGPEGDLEALSTLASPSDKKTIAIICHPNPVEGGTMYNKVVFTVARTFQTMGLKTVRFNYRGVGKSAGHYAHGEGETDDLLSIIDAVREQCPDHTLWLAGFSFGSYVSANAANQRIDQIEQLVSIAPAVVRHPGLFKLNKIACPWMVIQGDEDDVADPVATADWAHKMEPRPHLIKVPNAGHFFHGRLLDLQHVLRTLDANTH